eukprot:2231346-Prymnesium_polylepis.2
MTARLFGQLEGVSPAALRPCLCTLPVVVGRNPPTTGEGETHPLQFPRRRLGRHPVRATMASRCARPASLS